MSLDELKYGEIKKLMSVFGEIKKLVGVFGGKEELDQHPYIIGHPYLIRSVTFSYVGRLKEVFKNELVLEDASWCAVIGRFSEILRNGLESSDNSQIEPYKHDVTLSRGAIVDVTPYTHPLPTRAK